MKFWSSKKSTNLPEDSEYLRSVFNAYVSQWPDTNEKYRQWKPITVLPASKDEIKQAMKLKYAKESDPIIWSIYSAYCMEFSDLGNHLIERDFELITKFQNCKSLCFGKENKHNESNLFGTQCMLAVVMDHESQCNDIVQARDNLKRWDGWDPITLSDSEIDRIRQIVLNSIIEVSALLWEWRCFTVSVGKDTYIDDPA